MDWQSILHDHLGVPAFVISLIVLGWKVGGKFKVLDWFRGKNDRERELLSADESGFRATLMYRVIALEKANAQCEERLREQHIECDRRMADLNAYMKNIMEAIRKAGIDIAISASPPPSYPESAE